MVCKCYNVTILQYDTEYLQGGENGASHTY
jgi:hypothetical protein